MAELAVVCENKIVGWLPRPEIRADGAVFVLDAPELPVEDLRDPLALIAFSKIAVQVVPFWIGDQGEIVGRCSTEVDGHLCWRVDFMIDVASHQLDDISRIRGWRAAPQRIMDLGFPI